MNVSEQTIQAIRECNTKCFYMNRLYDTAMDTLSIDFVCPQAEKLMHENMAHTFPLLAAELNHKCLGAFNIKTYYGATPAGDWTWNNLLEMMEELMNETFGFQNVFMGALKVAIENNDYLVVVELNELLREVNKIVEQIILIRDKAELYGDNYTAFDKDIPSFFYLG